MSLETDTESKEPNQAATSPFQLPAFRWFFTGRLVSLLGSAMTPVALSLAVLNASNSPGDIGAVLTANTIPLIVFTLAGGIVGDRFPRRVVLLLSNLGAGLTQAVVAFLLISGHYNLLSLVLLEICNGTMAAFTNPALRGIVPDIVGKPQMQKANSALGSARNAAKVFGPTVAALLVATVGGGWAIAVDSATYLIAVVCLALVNITGTPPPRKGSPLADLRAGWTEFRSRTWVWSVVATFGAANFIQVGIWTVLGPTIAKERIGETSWGVVLSIRALGVLVMALVMYKLVLKRLLPIAQAGVALIALPLLALGLQTNVAWLAAAALLAGAATGLYGVAWETSLQEHIPRDMLSRISSYDNLGSFIAIPAGQLAAAPLAAAFGAPKVALVGGLIYVVLALLPLTTSSMRNLRHEV